MAKLFSDLADLKFEADAESARPLFKTPWLDDHIATQQAKRDADQAARDATAAARAEAAAVVAAKAAEPPPPPSVLKDGIDPADPNHPSNYFSQTQIGRATVDERRTRAKTWMAQQADKYLTPFGVEQYRAELGRKEDNAFGIVKDTSFLEGVRDLGVSLARGGAGAVGDIIKATGGGSEIADKVEGFSKGLESYRSQGSKVADQAAAAKLQTATESGDEWEIAKARFGKIKEAPLDTLFQGIGSFLPMLAAAAATIATGGGAGIAVGVAAGLGAAQGAGGVKGDIFDAMQKKALASGATPADAKAIAEKAQEYVGTGAGQIALAAALHATDALTGPVSALGKGAAKSVAASFGKTILGRTAEEVAAAEAKVAARGITNRAVRGAIAEAPLEGAQGGQGVYAVNAAEIAGGYRQEKDRFQGVLGNTAGDAMEGALVGGVIGGARGGQVAKATPAPVSPPVTPTTPNTAADQNQGQNTPPGTTTRTPKVDTRAKRAAIQAAFVDVDAAYQIGDQAQIDAKTAVYDALVAKAGQNTPPAGVSNADTATQTVAKTEPEVKRTPEQKTERVAVLNNVQKLSRVQNPTKQQTDRLKIARALAIEDGHATKGELDALAKNTTIGPNGELSNSDGKVLDKDGLANSIPPVPDTVPVPIGSGAPPTALGANETGNAVSEGQFQSSGRTAKRVEEIRAEIAALSPEDQVIARAEDADNIAFRETQLDEPTVVTATQRYLKAAVGAKVTLGSGDTATTGVLSLDATDGKYKITTDAGASVEVPVSNGVDGRKIAVPLRFTNKGRPGPVPPPQLVLDARAAVKDAANTVRKEAGAATRAQLRGEKKAAKEAQAAADEFQALQENQAKDDRAEARGPGVEPLQNQSGTTANSNHLNDVFAQQGVNATLDLIAKEGSTFDRSVIRAIREHVQSITNVAQRPGAMQNGLMGEYNPTTRQVWLAPGASQHTVLHELTHAAVDTIMHTDINKLSERQRKAVVTLNKMFAFAAANPRWEGRYAMTDVHEFIAEAMSNQQFQAELHSVSVQDLLKRPNESMWTAFTDALKRILGIDKDTLSSSLLTTRRLLDDLVSAPTERQSEVLRLIGQTRQKAPAKTVKGFVADKRDRLGTAFGDYGYVGLNQLQDERDAAQAAGDAKLAKVVEDVRQKIVLKDVAGSAERMAKDIAQPVEDLIKSLAKAGGMQPNDLRRVASEVAIAQHSLHLSKAWEEKAKAEVDATFEALENYGVVEGLRVKYGAQARSIAAEIDDFYNISLGKPTEDIDAEFIANKINELDEMMRVLGEDVEAAGKEPGISAEAASKMSAALAARRFGLRRSQDARRAIDAAHHQAQYLKTYLEGKPALAHKYEGMTQELRAWSAAQTQEPAMGPDNRLQFAGGHKLPGGMRMADAKEIIDTNAADPDGEAVNAVAEAYRNSFRQLAEKSVELGIVTPEAAAALREANPFYVNTQGTGETDIDANLNERNYRGFLDKAEGSSHYLNSNDVFTNLALRMNKLAQVDSSLALGKAAMKAVNAGSTAWELHLPDQSGRNYVRATVGGQTVFLSPISKELDKAIGGPDAMNPALKKWAATPTRVYGQLFTTYTGLFAPLSYVRDGLTRTFNLRGRESELVREDGTFVSVAEARARVGSQMANPVTLLDGFKHAYLGTNSPALQELIDAGGLTTFSEIVNTERKVEGQFAKGRGLERVKEEFVKWNKAFEVAQMLASYKGLRAAGIGQQQASFTGIDMVNFRRSGVVTSGVLKAFYLYANPVAQDIRGFSRNIVDRNGKLKVWGAVDIGVMMGVGTLLFAMAREASDDDELGGKVIDSMSDKELYSVIPIKLSDSVTIKIPIGFGWPQVAYTWAVAKYRADHGLITESDAINDSLKAFFGTFAVTGISEASYQKDLPLALAQMVMPDLLAPVVAAASGKNFMGGPLTGRLKDDVNKADQGKWRTPEAYKQIAQAVQSATGIDMAPESVQAIATGYAGGLLAAGLDIGLGLEQDRKEKGLSKDYAPTAIERALGLSRWYTRSDANKQAQAAFYREKERITDMQKDFNSEAPKGLGREDAAAKMARLARGGAAPDQVKQIESLAAYDKESKVIQERWKQADARRKGGEDISFLAEGIVAAEVALQTKFVKDVRKARGDLK